jgi:hypothetical protein
MTDEQVLTTILYSATHGWNVIDTGEQVQHSSSVGQQRGRKLSWPDVEGALQAIIHTT